MPSLHDVLSRVLLNTTSPQILIQMIKSKEYELDERNSYDNTLLHIIARRMACYDSSKAHLSEFQYFEIANTLCLYRANLLSIKNKYARSPIEEFLHEAKKVHSFENEDNDCAPYTAQAYFFILIQHYYPDPNIILNCLNVLPTYYRKKNGNVIHVNLSPLEEFGNLELALMPIDYDALSSTVKYYNYKPKMISAAISIYTLPLDCLNIVLKWIKTNHFSSNEWVDFTCLLKQQIELRESFFIKYHVSYPNFIEPIRALMISSEHDLFIRAMLQSNQCNLLNVVRLLIAEQIALRIPYILAAKLEQLMKRYQEVKSIFDQYQGISSLLNKEESNKIEPVYDALSALLPKIDLDLSQCAEDFVDGMLNLIGEKLHELSMQSKEDEKAALPRQKDSGGSNKRTAHIAFGLLGGEQEKKIKADPEYKAIIPEFSAV